MRLVGKALAIIACIFGIYVGMQLMSIHVDAAVNNAAGAIARCGSGGGCLTAAKSEYSTLLGIPIAALGFAFYVAALLVGVYSFFAAREEENESGDEDVAGLIFIGFILAALYSAFLAWVNFTQLTSSCSECTKLYVINGLGLFGSILWMLPDRLKRFVSRIPSQLTQLHFWMFVVTFAVAAGGAIWQMNKIERDFRENLQEKAEAGELPEGLSSTQVDTEVLYAEGAASWGDSDAPVTIVEFSDFECPFCARFAEVVNGLKEHYEPTELRVVFRHFPLSMHPRARVAAKAAACAQELGSFWDYHDLLFNNQGRFSDDQLRAYAEEAGLDGVGLLNCMDSDFAEQRVSQDRQAGQELGVQGTPSIYINGRTYEGPIDARNMRRLIDNLIEDAEASGSAAAGDATDE
jgi:protein-disulfide isomerase/uncharacterized membrane protein